MIKLPHSIDDLPTKMLEGISTASLWSAAEHDEWLLDEALAETFPASDSIAVSPPRSLRVSSTNKPQEVDGLSKTS